MWDGFFDTICKVGIFVICAQTIVHFRPKGDYEKYLKFLVGIMILIQLMLPLLELFYGDGSGTVALALEQFQEKWQGSAGEARESAMEADKRLEKMTLEEVRKRMEEQEKGEDEEKRPEGDVKDLKEETEKKIEIYVEPVVVE